MLILFLPFAFLKREFGKDKILFLGFSLFFIFVAYFTTAKQVRYIVPVLPFMAILAVMGIKNLSDGFKEKGGFSFKALQCSLFIVIVLLLSANLVYLKDHFKKIDPMPYVLGNESRDDFLKHHLLHYEAVQFINTYLPEDAVIYTIYLGRRGYYLKRNYKNDPSFGVKVIRKLVNASKNENDFKRKLNALMATHIFMRTDLVDRFLHLNYDQEEIRRFMNMAKKHWLLVYQKNNYAVWELADTCKYSD